jgi:hypothetical protein
MVLSKSAMSGIDKPPRPPSFLESLVQARCENLLSQDAPINWQLIFSNSGAASLKARISVGQTKLNLNVWNVYVKSKG